MSDKRARLKDLAEIVTAPAVAVLFWIMVILVVMMTAARPKFFEANIFEAFGAIGQVAFAGAVFWLGWQQFQFTKQMAKRQHNVDAFTLRSALLDKIDKHTELLSAGTEHIDDTFHYEAMRLMTQLGQLFTARISDDFFVYTQVLEDIIREKDRFITAKRHQQPSIGQTITALLSDARDLLFQVMNDMEEEMSIAD
jgi:hypothetical protein